MSKKCFTAPLHCCSYALAGQKHKHLVPPAHALLCNPAQTQMELLQVCTYDAQCLLQMQGNMVKRQANMWGAVPQHHHAVPPAQAQQFVLAQAQAAAQAQAQVQAQAQAQAMRHVDAPPPPPAQMGGFPHSAYVFLILCC